MILDITFLLAINLTLPNLISGEQNVQVPEPLIFALVHCHSFIPDRYPTVAKQEVQIYVIRCEIICSTGVYLACFNIDPVSFSLHYLIKLSA